MTFGLDTLTGITAKAKYLNFRWNLEAKAKKEASAQTYLKASPLMRRIN